MSLDRRGHEEIVGASGLSEPVQSVVMSVLGATRLWPREQADIARELVAHFRDGLASGAPEQDLLAGFGDPAVAARLMRRGKIRGRPLAWRAMRRGTQGLGAFVVLLMIVYGYAAVRFYASEPRISRDYVAELNQRVASVPAESRAWPLYRRAFFLLPTIPPELERSLPPSGPEDSSWSVAILYLAEARPALELTRAGAARSHLGLELSFAIDQEVAENRARIYRLPPPQALEAAPDEGKLLYGVLLPHLTELRMLARMLIADSRAAVSEGDLPRWQENFRAQLSMARHAREHAFVISQLVSLALTQGAVQDLGLVLRDSPEFLDENALRRMAHLLGALGMEDLRVSFDYERTVFDDFVQHAYSDDGRGDGRLTFKGLRTIEGLTAARNPVSAVLDPAVAFVAAGRRETLGLYHGLMDRTEAAVRRPLWEWEEIGFEAEFERAAGGPLAQQRYYPVHLLFPALHASGTAAYRVEQARDAALVAIALELHRRRVGAYPDSLDTLVPTLLPAVPRDQFTGGPIGYALRDGQPVVYSVGADRKDDGGRPVANNPGNASKWIAPSQVPQRLAQRNARDDIDGDWVLWPPARQEQGD